MEGLAQGQCGVCVQDWVVTPLLGRGSQLSPPHLDTSGEVRPAGLPLRNTPGQPGLRSLLVLGDLG